MKSATRSSETNLKEEYKTTTIGCGGRGHFEAAGFIYPLSNGTRTMSTPKLNPQASEDLREQYWGKYVCSVANCCLLILDRQELSK